MKKEYFSDQVFVCGARIEFVRMTTYEDYDESKSHNGGSYYQPIHNIIWTYDGDSYELTIEDTSCGDFGARVYVQLDKTNCCIAQAQYGSLAGEEYTDFNDAIFEHSVALAIAASVGYHIPYTEELEGGYNHDPA